VVGGEAADIERKLNWIFDIAKYSEFSISNIEKVREKVHTISTVITQEKAPAGPLVKRDENVKEMPQAKQSIEEYDPRLYAVGIATTMLAKDEEHALRKVGHALINRIKTTKSHSGATLSEDSTVTVEQIPMSTGHAKPRDVSGEKNRAHFVRG
jgi:hypothetical protein